MVKNIYSVYDKKAKYYSTVFLFSQDAEAVRAFSDVVKDKRTMIGLHPSDFSLYRIGRFDDNTGGVDKLTPVYFLNNGDDFIEKEDEQKEI